MSSQVSLLLHGWPADILEIWDSQGKDQGAVGLPSSRGWWQIQLRVEDLVNQVYLPALEIE